MKPEQMEQNRIRIRIARGEETHLLLESPSYFKYVALNTLHASSKTSAFFFNHSSLLSLCSFMSCLNLRLPPAKKAWKSFTSKFQFKLHKLHSSKSKAIKKKPKYQFNNNHTPPTSAKSALPLPRTLFLFQKRQQKRKRLLYHQSPHIKRSGHFQLCKKTAPVYIDKLFPEPVLEVLTKFPPSTKKVLDSQHEVSIPGSSRENGEKGADDEMWESLAIASPQLQGIDARAEQFILSFRADMELQEVIARGL